MKRILGLNQSEFLVAVTMSTLIGIGFLSIFQGAQISFLAISGYVLTAFIVIHMCLMARHSLILPEFICFIASINWIVAPTLAYSNLPSLSLYEMSVPIESYLSYIVPAVLALWIGMHTDSTSKYLDLNLSNQANAELNRRDRRVMDTYMIVGILVSVFSDHLPGGLYNLRFFYYILGQLRFVGALSYMFTRTKGWRMRIAIVYGLLFVQTAIGGVFYEFVLWAGYLLISIAYIRKWRWKLAIYTTILLILITFFNDIKGEYRKRIEMEDLSVTQKVNTLVDLYLQSLGGHGPERTFGDRLVRWNQGWIISRIMTVVPDYHPYAHGKTIEDALVASLLPRILSYNKMQAGSKDLFKEYTDIDLPEYTSMAMGVAGEMYANFGLAGGVAGMFVYGWMIGAAFSLFKRFSQQNILWWAWAPFVLLTTLEAEWNFFEVFNHIAKSGLVMAILLYLPSIRRLLFKNKNYGTSD